MIRTIASFILLALACTLLAAEPRVSATEIQTVGVKGYDGFAMALVTANL